MANLQPNIIELIGRMPATDEDLALQKAVGTDGQPKPPPKEPPASKFTGPDPDAADKIVEQIYDGGRSSVLELLACVKDPGGPEFKNYKAEYLVHCLVLYAGRPQKDSQRKLMIETLASQVGNGQLETYTRNVFVRELQSIGDKTAVPALAPLLTEEALCAPAAAALLSIHDGAAAVLRAALPKVTGYRRLVILQSLAVLKDRQSADAFRLALSDPDREIRLVGAWGLAQATDASAVDLLLKAADVEASYERIKATQACLVLAENLAGSGNRKGAITIYTHLRDSRTDPKEKYIRDLAGKALGET